MKTTKLEITAAIALLSIFCFMLLGLRVHLTHSYTMIFLIWNWILAFVPFGLSLLITNLNESKTMHKLTFAVLGILWLLFFPNAPYIITDLVHLKERAIIPLWFDAILLFSFAFTGLVAGLVSLYYVHYQFNKFFKGKFSWLFICIVSCLSAYGIYLGRFLRWNSWDILTQTEYLFDDIFISLFKIKAIMVTGIFASFLMASYFIVYIFLVKKENL